MALPERHSGLDFAAVTDVAAQHPVSELRREVTAVYQHFVELQRQKLLMLDYLVDRQEEFDDPRRAARTILCRRYPHLPAAEFDAVFQEVAKSLAALFDPEDEGDASADAPKVSREIDAFQVNYQAVIDSYSGSLSREYVEVAVMTFLQEVLRAVKSKNANAETLRLSIFTAIIADFEAFIASVLTRLYKDRPEKIGDGTRTVPLRQVLQSTDLQTLREELIDAAVVDIMRGNVDDWLSTFKNVFAIDVSEYAQGSGVSELFQRRNVIMHNGSVASRLYVEKCTGTSIRAGDRLQVSDEYLRAAADQLVVISLAITSRILFILEKDSQHELEDEVANWVYEMLLERRYAVVCTYMKRVPLARFLNKAAAEVCRVNNWIGLKRLGRFDECVGDVEAWQVAHLRQQFQLARMILLGDTETASRLSKEMLTSGTLRLSHWVEWPLLEEVREFDAGQQEESVEPPAVR